MTSVDRQDVKDSAKEDPPTVQVRGVEQGREEDPSSVTSGNSASLSSEGEMHVHEGDNIRSSYDVEEDVPLSLFQKLKGTFLGAQDKPRPQDALQAQNADPHTTSTHEDVAAGLKKPGGSSVQSDEKRGQLSSDELGTGYEEDTEKGGLASDSSADWSDMESSASQPGSLFKPIKETDPSELSLEDLRATKVKEVSSPDEIKAPGMFSRAMEEVEAVTEAAMEGLNLKDKGANSGDQHESGNGSGFFSRIAEMIGYDGHGRSQTR